MSFKISRRWVDRREERIRHVFMRDLPVFTVWSGIRTIASLHLFGIPWGGLRIVLAYRPTIKMTK